MPIGPVSAQPKSAYVRDWRRHSLWTACVLLLCLATVLFFNRFPRYLAGPPLLHNPDFAEALTGWQVKGSGAAEAIDGSLRLGLADATDGVEVSQTVKAPPLGSLLKLSCQLKSQTIQAGRRGWELGRVVLVSGDGQGKPIYAYPHVLSALTGSRDWMVETKVFAVAEGVAELKVAAQLMHSPGELWVKGCRLSKLELSQDFHAWRYALLTLWIGVGAGLILPWLRGGLLHAQDPLKRLLTAAILAGVLMPGEVKHQVGGWLARHGLQPAAVPDAFYKSSDFPYFETSLHWPDWDGFKLGHLGLFACLAFVLGADRSGWWVLSKLALFAGATEVLQLFIQGRTPKLTDIAIDCAGVLLGGLAAVCAKALARRALFRR